MKNQVLPKKWLTIDTCDVNSLVQSKFRTGTENDRQQICYFNHFKKDKIVNRFLTVRKETFADETIFSVVNLIGKSNNLENIYYKIHDKLKEFNNGRLQFKQTIQISSPHNQQRSGNETKQQQQQHVSKKPRFLSR